MRRVALFGEDLGHEAFITALINRLAREHRVELEVTPRSVRGGHGKMSDELKRFLRDLDRARQALPDLLVVATDANCKGLHERIREVTVDKDGKYHDFIVYAVPDPHIERWFLIDAAAFKSAVGKACAAPKQKCERDLYKRLLIEAVRAAGVTPLLGGLEYAEDIVNAMDLQRAGAADASLSHFLSELRPRLQHWASGA